MPLKELENSRRDGVVGIGAVQHLADPWMPKRLSDNLADRFLPIQRKRSDREKTFFVKNVFSRTKKRALGLGGLKMPGWLEDGTGKKFGLAIGVPVKLFNGFCRKVVGHGKRLCYAYRQ